MPSVGEKGRGKPASDVDKGKGEDRSNGEARDPSSTEADRSVRKADAFAPGTAKEATEDGQKVASGAAGESVSAEQVQESSKSSSGESTDKDTAKTSTKTSESLKTDEVKGSRTPSDASNESGSADDKQSVKDSSGSSSSSSTAAAAASESTQTRESMDKGSKDAAKDSTGASLDKQSAKEEEE